MSTPPAAEYSWPGEAGLYPELRALVACARAVIHPERAEQSHAAAAGCVDPEALCRAAIAQGMLGHLHRLVIEAEMRTGAGPSALGARLAELQRLSAQRNLRQTAHLLRILDQMRGAGVRVMPYKGPVWAERLYGDVTLRSWADLDLLVTYDQVAAARATLLSDGFVDAVAYNAKLSSRRRGGWGEVAFSSAGQGPHVEVHWEITGGFGGRSLEPEVLFARAERLRLLEREVLCPSPGDCLVISCINGTKDRWRKLETILGVAVQIPAINADAWQEVLPTARDAGCLRRVVIGVAHACRVLDLTVPAHVAHALARDRVARALLRSLDAGSLGSDPLEGSREELAAKFWRFATEDSVARGLWHAEVRFFRPGPEDWSWISLPSWAEWLYRVLRPFRLAAKWAKRL